MSILEDNRKIAEYVGYKIANKQEELRATFAKRYALSENSLIVIAPKKGDPNTGSVTIFDPSSDWNQLMEAVEKIEKDGYVVGINENQCDIFHYPIEQEFMRTSILRIDAETKIQAVYQAVLEYIKQQKEDK